MTRMLKCRIGDLGKVVTGRTPPSSKPECFGDEFPFITPSDMDGRKTIRTTERYISTAGYSLLRSNLLPASCVAVSCIGWQMGKSALTSRPSFTNQQLNSIIPDRGRVDADYLYYVLTTRREELKRLGSVGTRTPILNKSAFCALEVELPELTVQRRVASILSAYDDLIENNTRRIKILEEMAQMLYREWFVNFRFPGHEKVKMVQSELGPIPEGWSTLEVADLLKRHSARKVYKESDISQVGTVPVVDQSRDEFAGFHNESPDYNASLDHPVGIFGDHTCKMRLMVTPFSIGPNVVAFTSQTMKPMAYVFSLLRGLVSTREYKRHWTELTNKVVVVSTDALATRFSDEVTPTLALTDALMRMNTNLRATRDLLLPKLISGGIPVEAAEEGAQSAGGAMI